MNVRARVATTALGIAVIAAACDQATTSADGVSGPQQFVGAVGTSFPITSLPDPLDLGENYVICKDGPTSTFNVTANGSAVSGSPFTVNSNTCLVVYERSGTTETVASSENVADGVQLDEVVMTQLTCKLGQGSNCPAVFPVVTGPTTVFTGPLAGPTTSSAFSGYVGGSAGAEGLSGVLIIYSNSDVEEEGSGRFTGGGSFFLGEIRFTHGFELRCDASDPRQNLEINWLGNQFHLTQLTSAVCTWAADPKPPKADVNTYVGTGVGRLNQIPGALIEFTSTDAGEPGTKDTMTIKITPPAGHPLGTTPIVVSNYLTKGNHQAHKPTP